MKKVNSPCASVADRNENENGAIKDFFPIQILQYIKGWVSNWVLQLRPAPPLLLLLQTLHISWQDLVSQKKGGRKFAHDFLLMTKLAWFIELVQTRCKVRCQSVSRAGGVWSCKSSSIYLSIYRPFPRFHSFLAAMLSTHNLDINIPIRKRAIFVIPPHFKHTVGKISSPSRAIQWKVFFYIRKS